MKLSAALEFTHCCVEGKQGMEADPPGGWQIQELPLQEIDADQSHVARCVAPPLHDRRHQNNWFVVMDKNAREETIRALKIEEE